MIVHLVIDGAAESALGVGLDIVGSAARLVAAGLVEVPTGKATLRQRVVSLDGQPVRSGAGRKIEVDGALQLRDLGRTDVLVLPGVFAATEPSIAQLLGRAEIARAADLLARASARGVFLAASCSATFILAASGVLDGARATTTWWLAPAFARRFPAITLDAERMVVEADGVLTAGSALAHADLMLAIIARVGSPSLAKLVARYVLLDERVSQTRYMILEHLRVAAPAVHAAERFASANVGRQISTDELARAGAVSPRTLARRVHAALGMTPNEMVQRLRVAHAAHLLATTRASVEEVAGRVGYADAAAFRRVFRRFAGESPRGRRGTMA
ncbi:MAG: helix-turn-helix domain-containing protein [Proteobacteria bacterium]|nr:helix-turn-helix domain-containing protein [Pseudomonadota bacterium]